MIAEIEPSGLIRLGVRALELVWASALAYYVLFDEGTKSSKRKEEFFSIGKIPRARQAFDLYRWALNQYLSEQPSEWPSLKIRPVQFPATGTDSHIANELFLVTISWIIHHEIAHARRNHLNTIPINPLAEENEADQVATSWVCEAITSGDDPRHKPAFGVVTAILVLMDCDLRAGHLTSSTHPPSYERLMRCLDHIGLPDDSRVWSFVLFILEIHFSDVGFDFSSSDGSFREKCMSACFAIRDISNGK
ncbi:MAG: phage exclusion protein Lit family protein [Gallionella sp.]